MRVDAFFRLLAVVFLGLCVVPAGQASGDAARTLAIVTPQQMQSEQRLALVIGNGNYAKGALGQNPVNDATDIARALERMGFAVIAATDADRAQMRAKVREFGERLRNGGVGLFFYAGHGVQVQDRNYLIPVDADIGNEAEVIEESLSLDLVLKTMDDAGNRLNIVMLDACRDNPFTRGFRSAGTGLSAVNAADAATGMVIAFATAPGKTAANGSDRNGLWTAQLLRAFEGADTRLMSVFQAATEGAWRSSNGDQKPWVNQSFIGEFWFNRDQVGDVKLAAPVPPPQASPAAMPVVPVVAVVPSAPAKPGPVRMFRDCDDCPEMVELPAGEFRMGAPDSESVGGNREEQPQHHVRIAGFAIGRLELTFAQWDACVTAGACEAAYDRGWDHERRPVMNVHWKDAQAYVKWLSKVTGKHYRLPSEAEWEYAARAGTTTPYHFGKCIDFEQAAFDAGTQGHNSCIPSYGQRDQTAQVGSFEANAFGLHDMHGNVAEWVQDCWIDSHAGAPADGSARMDCDNASTRVVRGGSWADPRYRIRSGYRSPLGIFNRNAAVGIRVARDPD